MRWGSEKGDKPARHARRRWGGEGEAGVVDVLGSCPVGPPPTRSHATAPQSGVCSPPHMAPIGGSLPPPPPPPPLLLLWPPFHETKQIIKPRQTFGSDHHAMPCFPLSLALSLALSFFLYLCLSLSLSLTLKVKVKVSCIVNSKVCATQIEESNFRLSPIHCAIRRKL